MSVWRQLREAGADRPHGEPADRDKLIARQTHGATGPDLFTASGRTAKRAAKFAAIVIPAKRSASRDRKNAHALECVANPDKRKRFPGLFVAGPPPLSWPRLTRPSRFTVEALDGPVKPGHDIRKAGMGWRQRVFQSWRRTGRVGNIAGQTRRHGDADGRTGAFYEGRFRAAGADSRRKRERCSGKLRNMVKFRRLTARRFPEMCGKFAKKSENGRAADEKKATKHEKKRMAGSN